MGGPIWNFHVQLSVMVIYVPFARWVYKKYRPHANAHGGYYYVITADGEGTVAAVTRRGETGDLIYRVNGKLMLEYREILGSSC